MSVPDSAYRFPEGVPIEPVPAGTIVLIAGPALSPAEELARQAVLDEDGTDGMLFVATNMTAKKFFAACRRVAPSVDASRIGMVDCSGQEMGTSETGMRTRYVSTQSDLTGIGMKYSALYESLYADAADGRVRTGLINLTSLLMYNDLRRVFQFTQTLAGRIESADGTGVFSIDPTTHDDRTVNMFNQIADGLIEVRETDSEADGELRVRGLPSQPEGWQPFTLP
jgi:hypothetical protein